MGATQSLKKAIDEKNLRKSIEAVLEGADLTSKESKFSNFAEYAKSNNAPQIASYLQAELAIKAIETGKPIPGGGSVDDIQEEGHTFLTFATRNNIPHLINKLLERGASIDAIDRTGATGLLHAVDINNTELSSLLIAAKANVNVMNSWSQVPLYFAAMNTNAELTKLLLLAGANPNIPSNTGITPLIRSSTSDDFEIVKLLLEHNASVDIGCARSETALYAAAGKGNVKTIGILLKGGANPNLSNRDGYTPLINACRNNHQSTVQLLLSNRADPNIGAMDQTTPLIHAANHSQQFLEMLLAAGADINHQSLSGLTALCRALEQRNIVNTQFLLDRDANITIGTIRGSAFIEYVGILNLKVAVPQANQVRSSAENTNTLYVKDISTRLIQPGVAKSAIHAEAFLATKDTNSNNGSTHAVAKQPFKGSGYETLRASFNRTPSSMRNNESSPLNSTNDEESSLSLSQTPSALMSYPGQQQQQQQQPQQQQQQQLTSSMSHYQDYHHNNTLIHSQSNHQHQIDSQDLHASRSSLYSSGSFASPEPQQLLQSNATGTTPLVTPLKIPGSPNISRQTATSFSLFQATNASTPGTPTSLRAQIQSVTTNSTAGSPALMGSGITPPHQMVQPSPSRVINAQYHVPQSQKTNTLSRGIRGAAAGGGNQFSMGSTPKSLPIAQSPSQPLFFLNPNANLTPQQQPQQPQPQLQPQPQQLGGGDDSIAQQQQQQQQQQLEHPMIKTTMSRQMSALDLAAPQQTSTSGRYQPITSSLSNHQPQPNPTQFLQQQQQSNDVLLPPPPIPPPINDEYTKNDQNGLLQAPEPPSDCLPPVPPPPEDVYNQQVSIIAHNPAIMEVPPALPILPTHEEEPQQSIHFDSNGQEEELLEQEEPLDDSNPDEMNYKNWRVTQAEGEVYYYNQVTKTTRWTRPALLSNISQTCAKGCGCNSFNHKDGSNRVHRCQCGHDH
jgi:ankyrin repeat protein